MDRPISISPFIKRLINECFLYKLECYLIEKTLGIVAHQAG